MDKIKTMLCVLLLLTGYAIGNSQNQSITGIVTSKTDGLPIIGATVIEAGNSSNGTVTDLDGKFTLQVKQGAQVTISYIGYTSVTVDAAPTLNIVLSEDNEMLEEVVVTGYSTQRKADLTGSVAVVSTDELKTISDPGDHGQPAGILQRRHRPI